MTPPPYSGRVKIVGTCEALYGDGFIEVSATDDEEVVVPVNPGTVAQSAVAVMHTGEEVPHRWAQGPNGVLIMVPSSRGPIRCIRIRW